MSVPAEGRAGVSSATRCVLASCLCPHTHPGCAEGHRTGVGPGGQAHEH